MIPPYEKESTLPSASKIFFLSFFFLNQFKHIVNCNEPSFNCSGGAKEHFEFLQKLYQDSCKSLHG
jgi:hypothetical protein